MDVVVTAAAWLDDASVRNELLYRVVGTAPPPGATRGESRRWVPKFYRFNLAGITLFVITALFVGGKFLWVVAAVTATLSPLAWYSSR